MVWIAVITEEQISAPIEVEHMYIFPLLEILFDKLASRQIADRGGGEIWFYKKSGNMDVVNQANTIASDECPSVARWPASEEGGDCCSLPATHQIDRRACPNISGTSWGLSIHYLRAIEDVPLQLERRFAPPFWERLDRPHCRSRKWEGISKVMSPQYSFWVKTAKIHPKCGGLRWPQNRKNLFPPCLYIVMASYFTWGSKIQDLVPP